MSVNYRSLDLATNKTVWYGVQTVQIEFIKCKTTDPLLWVGRRIGKRSNWALLLRKQKCDMRDLQNASLVLCVLEASRAQPEDTDFYKMVLLCHSPWLCVKIWTNSTPAVGWGKHAQFHDLLAYRTERPGTTFHGDV